MLYTLQAFATFRVSPRATQTTNQITKMNTIAKPHVTFTNFKGEWMIRCNVQLTRDNTINSTVEIIGGKEISLLGEIEVTLKSGATKTVRIGEYEKCFKNADGTESHIYSVRSI